MTAEASQLQQATNELKDELEVTKSDLSQSRSSGQTIHAQHDELHRAIREKDAALAKIEAKVRTCDPFRSQATAHPHYTCDPSWLMQKSAPLTQLQHCKKRP